MAAVGNAQSTIQGIDIDKLVKGFSEDELLIEKFVTVSQTAARNVRWYQKTSGFIDTPTTTGMTSSLMLVTDQKAIAPVLEQTWTRNNSLVIPFFVESPWISEEDLRDTDVDLMAGNVRDLVRGVQRKVESHIWDTLTESRSVVNISNVTTNAAWNAASFTGVDIVEDLMEAKLNIRNNGYDPEGAILLLSTLDHKSLIDWLITGKGSSIPAFASQRIGDGVVMEILGLRVIVSTIVTADYACVFVPMKALTFKEFLPLSTAVVEDPLVGKKIRVKREGIALLTDPKAVSLITNTQA